MLTTTQTTRERFAIVCDSGCDLSKDFLAAARVICVPLVGRDALLDRRSAGNRTGTDLFKRLSGVRGKVQLESPPPGVGEFREVYERLAKQGYRSIISLHVSSAMRDVCSFATRAAAQVSSVDIHVIDSNCVSAQMALVLARLVADRDAGMDAEHAARRSVEVARATRLLVIPAPGALSERLKSGGRPALHKKVLGTADSLRTRALGARRAFSVDKDGSVREFSRSTELPRLAGVIARAMSTYAREVGPLTYVKVRSGVSVLLPIIEKHLDTNEFDAECAGVLRTNTYTTMEMGAGAAGVAYVPTSLVLAQEARTLMGLDDSLEADGG